MISVASADEAPSDYRLSLDGYTLKGAQSAHSHPPGSISEGAPSVKQLDRPGWISALHWSEFCYVGRVDTLVADCILDPDHAVQYIALVRFKIEEPFWGVANAHHIAEVHLQNAGECIRYDTPYPHPPDIGDTFLAYGYITEGRIKIKDTQLLQLIDDIWIDPVGNPLQTPDLFELIDTVKTKRDIPSTFEAADCVVTAQALYSTTTDAGKMTFLRVEIIHAGLDDIPYVIRIVHEHDTRTDDVVDWTYDPIFTDGARHLLALRARSDGDFACINGLFGAWRIEGDNLLTVRNQPTASYSDMIAVARSLNKPHRLRKVRSEQRH